MVVLLLGHASVPWTQHCTGTHTHAGIHGVIATNPTQADQSHWTNTEPHPEGLRSKKKRKKKEKKKEKHVYGLQKAWGFVWGKPRRNIGGRGNRIRRTGKH